MMSKTKMFALLVSMVPVFFLVGMALQSTSIGNNLQKLSEGKATAKDREDIEIAGSSMFIIAASVAVISVVLMLMKGGAKVKGYGKLKY